MKIVSYVVFVVPRYPRTDPLIPLVRPCDLKNDVGVTSARNGITDIRQGRPFRVPGLTKKGRLLPRTERTEGTKECFTD